MKLFYGRLGSQRGFTLIETMAALTIFTIMILGLAPLLATSMRGAALSRSYTVGKSLAQGAMERVRGLPFFDAAPKRDAVDLYFPDLVASGANGYNSTTKTYTTVCTATSSLPAVAGPLACPPKRIDGTSQIPAGYTVTFSAQFVNVVANSNPETYNVITPTAGWTSASSTPPSRMLRLTIATSWQQGARTARFNLQSLIGDRKLAPDKVKAQARLDFLAQAFTSYQVPAGEPNAGKRSTLRAYTGRLESNATLKDFATATQESRAAQLTLSAQEYGGAPGSVTEDDSGAQVVLSAPPTASSSTVTGVAQDVAAPAGVTVAGGKIAGMTGTDVHELQSPSPGATVANELPRAAGNFGYPGGSTEEFWVTNQADTGTNSLLKLAVNSHVFSVLQPASAQQSKRIFGSTYAETFPVSTTALRVRSTSKAQADKIQLFPTTFTGGGKPVLMIEQFTATADCQVSGTAATATGSWSASISFWENSNYTKINLSGSTTGTVPSPNPLEEVRARNPLVTGLAGSASALYLFDEPGKPGFLDSWSYTPVMTKATPDTRTARVSMASAISIVTAKTQADNPESKLSISIGGMSCEAVDKRA